MYAKTGAVCHTLAIVGARLVCHGYQHRERLQSGRHDGWTTTVAALAYLLLLQGLHWHAGSRHWVLPWALCCPALGSRRCAPTAFSCFQSPAPPPALAHPKLACRGDTDASGDLSVRSYLQTIAALHSCGTSEFFLMTLVCKHVRYNDML